MTKSKSYTQFFLKPPFYDETFHLTV